LLSLSLKTVLLYLLLLPTLSQACSCVPRTDLELFRAAHAIALIKVIDTKLVSDSDARPWQPNIDLSFVPELDVVEAHFRVIESFKGATNMPEIVRALPPGFGNCSPGLIAGVYYVVYLTRNELLGTCSGTRDVNIWYRDFNKDLAKLRRWGKGSLGRE
jgi:hypothetical protein